MVYTLDNWNRYDFSFCVLFAPIERNEWSAKNREILAIDCWIVASTHTCESRECRIQWTRPEFMSMSMDYGGHEKNFFLHFRTSIHRTNKTWSIDRVSSRTVKLMKNSKIPSWNHNSQHECSWNLRKRAEKLFKNLKQKFGPFIKYVDIFHAIVSAFQANCTKPTAAAASEEDMKSTQMNFRRWWNRAPHTPCARCLWLAAGEVKSI